MVHHASGRLAVVLVWILFLGGCLSPNGDPRDSPSPPVGGGDDSPLRPWNFTVALQQDFDPDPVAPVLLASEAMEVVGAKFEDSSLHFGRLDFRTGRVDHSPAGLRPATRVTQLFGVVTKAHTYVLAESDAPQGCQPFTGSCFPIWADYSNGAWAIEEAPLRWLNAHVRGVAALDETPFALIWHADGTRLWSLRGATWSMEPVLGFQLAPLRLFGNGTHLFMVGIAADGSLVVDSRGAGETLFQRHVLLPPRGVLSGLVAEPAAYPGGPPVIAFQITGFPTNLDNGLTKVARPVGSTWTVEDVVNGGGYPLRYVGTSSNATFLAQAREFGSSLWRPQNGTWTACDLPERFALTDPTLLSYAREVWIVSKQLGADEVRVDRLDPEAASCLAEDSNLDR